MEGLPNKLRKEIHSIRHSLERGRVHLWRKLVAEIHNLSKKKFNGPQQNEKNTRKMHRLTDELKELKQLKLNAIVEFVVSHTAESAEAVRRTAEVSSRDRVLAKLVLQKVVKPLIESFHKTYLKWQESLANHLIKNTGQTEGSTSSTIAEIENNERGKSTNETDYKERINDFNDMTSDVKMNTSKDDTQTSEETNLEAPENTVAMGVDNKIAKKRSALSKSPFSLKKPKTTPLKNSGNPYTKWEVHNISEYTCSSEQNGNESLCQKEREDNEKPMKANDKSVTTRDFSQPKGGQDKKLGDISAKKLNNQSETVGSNENLNILQTSQQNINDIQPHVQSQQKIGGFSLKTEDGKSNTVKLSQIKLETKSKSIASNKSKKIVPKVSQMRNLTPPTEIQQSEDPFFLTKGNDKYMTFGKIVEESKEPLLKATNVKTFSKNWDNRKSFNNLGKREKFQRNDTLGKQNKINKSLSENKMQLHPSWEARKKISTILPFEGKKISFDD